MLCTSMKTPSTPTATAVLAMHGISSRRPPLATPPSSNYIRMKLLNNFVERDFKKKKKKRVEEEEEEDILST